MKLSFAISVQDTKFESVAGGNWRENINLMARLGFQGIELAIRNPKSIDSNELQSLLGKLDLKLVAIGTGQVYFDDGLSLSDPKESVRSGALSRLKELIDLAKIFDCQIIIGLIRGNLGEGSERQLKMEHLKDSILETADYAQKGNVTLIVEPLNRYECDCFNRAEEVINFIQETKCPNLKLLLDTFHMNIEEKDICETLINSKEYLSHVHIADSNRRCPGEGHLDFSEIISVLKQINYCGYLSGEMLSPLDLKRTMEDYISRMGEILDG